MGMIREREELSGGEAIRKGPWKAEEDEVLINHVRKYGPRDWSSIRSKGLLRRTGKSCRLRWVNKLRPNLKNGVKFSGEEERVVIELQGQFGNKWARIARYLPGRTDNDVKNFWSSRQKRLARILQTPAPPNRGIPDGDDLPTLECEAPNFSSSVKEESSSKIQSCSSSSSLYVENSEMIKMVPLPDLINPNLLNLETQPEINPTTKTSYISPPPQTASLQFPPQDLSLSSLAQEVATSLEDPDFLDVFGGRDGQLSLCMPPFLALEGNCQNGGKELNSPMTPDSFFDDFPTDMFDHIEPLPSPSDW